MPPSDPDSIKYTKAKQRSQEAYRRRQARYQEAARLKAAGMSLRRIVAVLGTERKTVRQWLRTSGAALWRKPPRSGLLVPFRTHLERHWIEGCHNEAQLWRELVTVGFAGRPEPCGNGRESDAKANHLPPAHPSCRAWLTSPNQRARSRVF